MVDGVKVGSCLGDLYSINWMEDSDKLLKQKAGDVAPGHLGARLGDQFRRSVEEHDICHIGCVDGLIVRPFRSRGHTPPPTIPTPTMVVCLLRANHAACRT